MPSSANCWVFRFLRIIRRSSNSFRGRECFRSSLPRKTAVFLVKSRFFAVSAESRPAQKRQFDFIPFSFLINIKNSLSPPCVPAPALPPRVSLYRNSCIFFPISVLFMSFPRSFPLLLLQKRVNAKQPRFRLCALCLFPLFNSSAFQQFP